MIKKLNLQNFKSFGNLDLSDLSRITLVGGRNNIGKTSLLESIFFFYDLGDPSFLIRLQAWRGLDAFSVDADTLAAPIFRDFDKGRQIKIELQEDIYHGEMNVAFVSSLAQKSIDVTLTEGNTLAQQLSPEQSMLISYALDIQYKIDGQKDLQTRLTVKQSPTNLNIQFEPGLTSGFPEGMARGAAFFGLRTKSDPGEDAVRFGQLDIIPGKVNQIVDLLKILEPSLLSLSSVAVHPQKSIIHADIGMGRKIPVAYMGDGMSRLLSILLAIAAIKRGIILIDEIDAGIHYSVLPKIWEGICRAAREFQCQIIATTHSYECLRAAYEGASLANASSEFRYIRFDQKDKEIVAKPYTHKVLGAALEEGWEVR